MGSQRVGHDLVMKHTMHSYNIAEDLYQNQKMHTKAHHDFLYNKVLNIVALHEHASKIGTSMNRTLGITGSNYQSTKATEYSWVNNYYKDIVYYTECVEVKKDGVLQYAYKYADQDGTFASRALGEDEDDLLGALNTASETEFETVLDWVYNVTPTVKNSQGQAVYPGCYTKVDYDWENYLYPPATGQNEGFSSSE